LSSCLSLSFSFLPKYCTLSLTNVQGSLLPRPFALHCADVQRSSVRPVRTCVDKSYSLSKCVHILVFAWLCESLCVWMRVCLPLLMLPPIVFSKMFMCNSLAQFRVCGVLQCKRVRVCVAHTNTCTHTYTHIRTRYVFDVSDQFSESIAHRRESKGAYTHPPLRSRLLSLPISLFFSLSPS
jgi:hypothetical protein